MTIRIALVGPGSMGRAMIQGWQRVTEIEVIAVHPRCPEISRVSVVADLESLPCSVDAVVLAVKPQRLAEILPGVGQWMESQSRQPLLISVAAAKPLRFYSPYFTQPVTIVRWMPNLPVAQGAGVVGVYAEALTPSHHSLIQALAQPLGQLVWMRSEELLDLLTLITGSGPAFVFLLMQALMEAAIAHGATSDEADTIVRQLIYGSGILLEQDTTSPSEWIRRVTSPNGTTSKALEVLTNGNFSNLFKDAIAAGLGRITELK